ncbi:MULTISPECIES: type II toxin-antitoxin system RelE/ParE family toxin [Pseudomonas]|jgi:phage-related protein|nr:MULTISPECIES: type II toxin-antitoxin system RelE/ParE family toxin [Pseudomonas]MBN2987242.1 type II toxin-antitoxin system RelE/ParE family toxin [Pseudomonas lactucae]MBS6082448.1 type II toxin-antitoxin system RelE/ParE family toxin [Pseudomonas fluorescens]
MKKKNDTTAIERKPDLLIEFYPHKAVLKEMGKLPDQVRESFIVSLHLMAKHQLPACETDQLISIHKDVYELIENGSPAYRCVYTIEVTGKIIVLHACKKTTNGPDPQIKSTVTLRRKALISELKADAKASKKEKKK